MCGHQIHEIKKSTQNESILRICYIFAVRNDGLLTCRLARVQASGMTVVLFFLYKCHIVKQLSVCYFTLEFDGIFVPCSMVNRKFEIVMPSFFCTYLGCHRNPFSEFHGCFYNVWKFRIPLIFGHHFIEEFFSNSDSVSVTACHIRTFCRIYCIS